MEFCIYNRVNGKAGKSLNVRFLICKLSILHGPPPQGYYCDDYVIVKVLETLAAHESTT